MNLKNSFKKIWKILKEAASNWWDKDPFRESATIAYYAIFSIPALLAIVVSIVSLFFGQEVVTGQISEQISEAMSPEAARQIEGMISNGIEAKKSIVATIIGAATLLFGATGVLVQLQKSLNNIWEVKIDPDRRQWLYTIKSRLLSLGIIVTLGFLMLVSMAVTVALVALSDWIAARFPDALTYVIEVINFLISLTVIAVLFALVYKVLPDAKLKWRHVIIGGFITALLFLLGKFALGFYFGKSQPASSYGAAGSVVLILLWVSYSSMIVFFGAEFTRSLVRNIGHKVTPKKNAVHVPGLNEDIIKVNKQNAKTKASK